jgi:hypothetical protein
MSDTRTTRSAWVALGAGPLVLALISACVPKAAQRQTDIMARTGAVTMSTAELRIRVNDLADRLAGRLETMADRIGAETQDRAIRRRALLVKVEVIPPCTARPIARIRWSPP